MLPLDRNENITYDKCGTQTTKKNTVRYKTRCSAGTLYCTECPKFPTTSQTDLNYHIAKKHATTRVKLTHMCKKCFIDFSGLFSSRQHKTSELGIRKKSTEFDVNNFLEDNDAELREKLQACQHFLVESELEKERHRVFNFVTSAFDNTLINKKLDLLIKGLKCGAKVNLAFGFVLNNVEE